MSSAVISGSSFIAADYVRLMARYNSWQNKSLIGATDTLDDTARSLDRGGFFGSIMGTFAHILWGDQMWMSRFHDIPKPSTPISESSCYNGDWTALKSDRFAMDEVIESWAASIGASDLVGDLTWYSGALQKQVSRNKSHLVAHFFNHQTHHRGQIHAMLTAAGARPDDTDLMILS